MTHGRLWRREAREKVSGVWLHLTPKENPAAGAILQGAVEAGFELHSVNKGGITLKHWLLTVRHSGSHHQIGIAGMVINARDEVLVIQERRGVRQVWRTSGSYLVVL